MANRIDHNNDHVLPLIDRSCAAPLGGYFCFLYLDLISLIQCVDIHLLLAMVNGRSFDSICIFKFISVSYGLNIEAAPLVSISTSWLTDWLTLTMCRTCGRAQRLIHYSLFT